MNLNRIVNAFGTAEAVPFAPRAKLIPAELGAAAITGAGNILNNVLGGIFQSNANKQNIALQRETNAQNYKMFKEQQQFNIDMWNKQNEYNTPTAQVQRLLAAGINPQAFFGSGNANVAGQVQSPTAPTMQAPHVNPYEPQLKVGEAVNAYYQSQLATAQKKKMNAETAHTEQLTLFEQKSMADRLKLLRNQANKEGWQGDLARTQLEYEQRSLESRLKGLNNDIYLQEQQMQLNVEKIIEAKLQNELNKIQVTYQPKLKEAELQQYYATTQKAFNEAKLALANKTLTEKEAELEAKRIVGQVIENGLKGYDFNLKQRTIDTIVNSTREDYYKKYNENRYHDFGPVRVDRKAPFWSNQGWKGNPDNGE